MVHIQPLHIESVINSVHEYLGKQKTPVKAKTIATRVNLTPKQARYMLRTYFEDYKISEKLSTRRYYLKN